MSLKVLLLINETTDSGLQAMAPRRWMYIIKTLQQKGVQLCLGMLHRRGALNEIFEDEGSETFALGTHGTSDSFGYLPRLARFAREMRFDIVQGDEVIPAILCGLAIRDRRSRGVVYYRHHASGSLRLNLASRVAARLADATFVPSDAVRRCALEVDHTPADRIYLVGSGTPPPHRVDPALSARIRRELGISARDIVVLAVARLRYEKGIDVLIDAFAGFRQVNPELAQLVIVGSGPEEETLKRQAETLGLRAHFVGQQVDPEPFYELAHLVAIPSRREAFGLVASEAMARAKPILGASVGGLTEIIEDGRNGWLVEAEDAAAWAIALQRVLASPSELARAGVEGHIMYTEAFQLEHSLNRWIQAWERILRAKRPDTS